MYLFQNAATGRVLEVKQSSLERAVKLLSSLDIGATETADLPTGAAWPVVPLVCVIYCPKSAHRIPQLTCQSNLRKSAGSAGDPRRLDLAFC